MDLHSAAVKLQEFCTLQPIPGHGEYQGQHRYSLASSSLHPQTTGVRGHVLQFPPKNVFEPP